MCNKIYEFDPKIYPQRLWVSVGAKKEDLVEFEDVSEMNDYAIATTTPIVNKAKNKGGVLIRFRSKKDMTLSIVAHESTHAAMCILDYVGVEFDAENQEPVAYMIGWIAECIDKVKRGKLTSNE